MSLTTPKHGWATADDWKTHRRTITTLYSDQRKTLREVMEVMQTHHNFYATANAKPNSERMYKGRFKAWGLAKNIKSDVKDAQFRHHRPAVLHASSKQGGRNKTNSYRPQARFPSPLSSRLKSPSHLRAAEGSVDAVLRYTNNRFENRVWDLRSWQDGDFDTDLARNWWHDVCLAADKIMEGSELAASFQMLNRCYGQYGGLLRKDDPSLVYCSYITVIKLGKIGQDLASSFAGFAGGMCAIQLGRLHPFTQFWINVQAMGRDEVCRAALAVLMAQFDTFKKHANPGNRYWAVSLIHLVIQLFDCRVIRVETAEAIVWSVINEMRNNMGPDAMESQRWLNWARQALAKILTISDDPLRYEKSDALLRDVQQWYEGGGSDRYPTYGIEFSARRAPVSEAFGRIDEAERFRRMTVDLCYAHKPRGHRRTLRALSDLEHFYRRRGDVGAAEMAHREYHVELNQLVREVKVEEAV